MYLFYQINLTRISGNVKLINLLDLDLKIDISITYVYEIYIDSCALLSIHINFLKVLAKCPGHVDSKNADEIKF